MNCQLLQGDALEVLRSLPSESVNCCITSPPYFGLRDYGAEGQLGLETTPKAYISTLVAVFGEVRRVLSEDGTLWLNIGDSYAGSGTTGLAALQEGRRFVGVELNPDYVKLAVKRIGGAKLALDFDAAEEDSGDV